MLIDQYMGWSHAGNTRQKYQHYYNDDSFDGILTMMDGLKPIAPAKGKVLLKPRLCPNCAETNTPESRFCAKCKFVLTFDAYNESIADAEHAKEEQQKLREEAGRMRKEFQEMLESMGDMKKQLYYVLELNTKQDKNFNELYDFANELLQQKQNKNKK